MQYVGIHTQQRRNNMRSLTLLILFPVLVAALVWLFCFLLVWLGTDTSYYGHYDILGSSLDVFSGVIPYAMGGVLLWFVIAYFANTSMINKATHSLPLERKDNKRIYNLVENLCMAQGMPMPMVNVIEDASLNAFASGISRKTYTVTLTRGIIDTLDDDELEGVIAHELSHIRNNDVRLLIVSIVFVGIFTMISEIAVRAVMHGRIRTKNDKGGGIILLLLIALVAFVGYLFATMMRFAISRKREYLADAGAAEMTKNPQALAGALRKISGNPDVEGIERQDVAQLFIQCPLKNKKKGGGIAALFATHPPIEQRIRILEQF